MTPAQLILMAFAVALIRPDETIRQYGMGQDTWQVTTLHGTPFEARATLRFSGRNRLAGDAPCNSFTTRMEIPFPWFKVGPIAATRGACPDLAAEQAFFAALTTTTIAQVNNGTLTLSDDTADLITLRRAD